MYTLAPVSPPQAGNPEHSRVSPPGMFDALLLGTHGRTGRGGTGRMHIGTSSRPSPRDARREAAPYQRPSRRPIADALRRTAYGAVRVCLRWDVHPDAI